MSNNTVLIDLDITCVRDNNKTSEGTVFLRGGISNSPWTGAKRVVEEHLNCVISTVTVSIFIRCPDEHIDDFTMRGGDPCERIPNVELSELFIDWFFVVSNIFSMVAFSTLH